MKPMNESLHIVTDDTLRETLHHGDSSFPFAYYLENVWQFDFHCVDWHWHHEVEFMTVTEGSLLCLVGTDRIRLPEGCGMFINSSILHRFEAADHVLVPNIVFSPCLLAPEHSLIYEKYVYPVISSAAAYQIFDPQVEWQDEILHLLTQIYNLQNQSQRKELLTMQFLFQIWDLLTRHMEPPSDPSGIHRLNHRHARLQVMMQYIHDHYREELTLDNIAAAAAVSKSGALHIFRSGIHIPPVSYLIQYRLMQAADQLHTTEKSVSAIAEETGFASAGYFCRKFRERYQMSPLEYRKKKFVKLYSKGTP